MMQHSSMHMLDTLHNRSQKGLVGCAPLELAIHVNVLSIVTARHAMLQ